MPKTRKSVAKDYPALMVEFPVLNSLKMLPGGQLKEVVTQIVAYIMGQPITEPKQLAARLMLHRLIEDHDRHMANYQNICENSRRSARIRWSRQKSGQAEQDTAEVQTVSSCDTADADACSCMQTDTNQKQNPSLIPNQTRTPNTNLNMNLNSNPTQNPKPVGQVPGTDTGSAGPEGQQDLLFHPEAPCTAAEAQLYAQQNHLNVNVGQFISHYEGTGWKDRDGSPVRDWRKVLWAWSTAADRRAAAPQAQAPQPRQLREQQYPQREYENPVGLPDWMKEMLEQEKSKVQDGAGEKPPEG